MVPGEPPPPAALPPQDSQGSAIAAMDAQGNNYEQYKQMFDDRYAGGAMWLLT